MLEEKKIISTNRVQPVATRKTVNPHIKEDKTMKDGLKNR